MAGSDLDPGRRRRAALGVWLADPGRERRAPGVPPLAERILGPAAGLREPPHHGRLLPDRDRAGVALVVRRALRGAAVEHARARQLLAHLVAPDRHLRDEVHPGRARRRPPRDRPRVRALQLPALARGGRADLSGGRAQPQRARRRGRLHLRRGARGEGAARLPGALRLPARRGTDDVHGRAGAGRALPACASHRSSRRPSTAACAARSRSRSRSWRRLAALEKDWFDARQ